MKIACVCAAAMAAVAALAADVRTSSPANVRFSDSELLIRPHVFLPGWKMVGATGGRTEGEGALPCCPVRKRLQGSKGEL